MDVAKENAKFSQQAMSCDSTSAFKSSYKLLKNRDTKKLCISCGGALSCAPVG